MVKKPCIARPFLFNYTSSCLLLRTRTYMVSRKWTRTYIVSRFVLKENKYGVYQYFLDIDFKPFKVF